MSMYGENQWDKNDLYDMLLSFLDGHPVSELLQVVADVVESYGYLKAEED